MLGQALPRLRTNLPTPKVTELTFEAAKRDGRFKSLKKLGQGAFGAAFSAKLNGRSVIVKTAVGTPGLISPIEAVDSMKREVTVLARLQKYPFVPRIVEVGLNYFVQEDVEGVSLLNLLAKDGLEARELIATVVAAGVIASILHKDGVAHNDYEPRNILLTPQGVVAIDFGIAVTKDDGAAAFNAAMERDIVSLLEDILLVLSSRDIPQQIRMVLANTVKKFASIVQDGKVNASTANQLSQEILFAAAQLGARAVRQGKLKKDPIKVVIV